MHLPVLPTRFRHNILKHKVCQVGVVCGQALCPAATPTALGAPVPAMAVCCACCVSSCMLYLLYFCMLHLLSE